MKCPKCFSSNIGVIDSRYLKHLDSHYKRRRRVCHDCEERFSTFEVMLLDGMDTFVTIKATEQIKIETKKTNIDETAQDIIRYIKENYEP